MSKRILIVDDQAGWRSFHTKAVKNILGDSVIIETAELAGIAYNKLLENSNNPYDIIITDMQMEDDYAPKMAGEWLVEQIQNLPSYFKTKIVIISASPRVKQIAESYNVFYIPKSTAADELQSYTKIIAP